MTKSKFEMLLDELFETRDEAAKVLGVGRSTLFRWLRGESRVPKVVMLALNLMKRN